MKDLNIVGPYQGDPFFYTDWNNGLVEFIGKLATHHEIIIKDYFQPFAGGLSDYFSTNKSKNLDFNVKLTYFNTSGSKHLLNIFQLLEEYEKSGKAKITVNWFYLKEDLDMVEVVEDYNDLVNLDFELKPVADYDYWDNLNKFCDFVSEPANFSVLKELGNLLKSKEYSQVQIEKAKSLVEKFEDKITFIPEFKALVKRRLQFLLKASFDAEVINRLFAK